MLAVPLLSSCCLPPNAPTFAPTAPVTLIMHHLLLLLLLLHLLSRLLLVQLLLLLELVRLPHLKLLDLTHRHG